MNVLAVIPARENSKRIPNKTLRLVNNHPLIYYVIKNALESKYISRIIVTTNSKEIEILCNQLGVECLIRDPELCTDDTTLDAVVYDVVRRCECDYVVTLQPTSPLLKVDSLDRAIEKMMADKLDTLISVVNYPRLRWIKDETGIVPTYKERVNSQYLRPHYQETGAFIISKKNVTTELTRIGEKVDLFEVSKEEAITIDTFQDLALASFILSQKKIAIYVNGNNQIGMGHIYRSLELADEFYCKPDMYFDITQTSRCVFGETNHELIPVKGVSELLEVVKRKKYDVFINDVLSTSSQYMLQLKENMPETKIVNFEDCGEGSYLADLVINALYQDAHASNVKIGEKYYIAPKMFMLYEPITIRTVVKDVLITFGGADPQNYSEKILEIIANDIERYGKFNFHVVLGRAKKNIDEILKYNRFSNIDIMYDIHDMPAVMSRCDIAITSRGRTCYELAMMGIPAIAMAQNRREETHGFANHENGFNYLGLKPSTAIIKANLDLYLNSSKAERQALQNVLLSKDLRNGRERVMHLINSL